MKRNVFLVLLIAAALVFCFTGCKTEDNGEEKGDPFDFTEYVGDWIIVGVPYASPPGTVHAGAGKSYMVVGNGNIPAPYDFFNGWVLTISKNGNFRLVGEVMSRDTDAKGKLLYDKNEPGFLTIKPQSGVWDKGTAKEEAIDKNTMAGFVSLINNVLEDGNGGFTAGLWIMYGGMEVFDVVWAKKPTL